MVQKFKNLRQSAEGFTIIEVLIVLAIAGLILLIVFLAVPALQRNSRNTGRKNDVANILGAMSEFTNNNGGQFPATCAAGATGCNAAGTFLANAKIGTIDPNQVAFTKFATAQPLASYAVPAGLDAVNLYSFGKCASATAPTPTNASSRSLIALYLVETGGNPTTQCVESGS